MFLYLPSIQKAFQFHALFFGQNSFNTARNEHIYCFTSPTKQCFSYIHLYFL